MILIDAQGLVMSRPGRSLFDDLSLTMSTGDRVGVVGLNGSGKSTLLRVLAGDTEPEAGTVRRAANSDIAVLDQGDDLGSGTVREVVGGDWRAEAVLDQLGLTPLLGMDIDDVSGGERKRAALARALSAESDLLILDEPTNHLDIDAIAWLEEWLADYRGGLLLVTHDRHVLDRVTTRVLEIDRTGSYVHDGGYAGYLQGRADRVVRAEAEESVRANLAKRELAWLRRGAPARTSKSKARIARAEALQEVEVVDDVRSNDLDLHLGMPRLGTSVVELSDVTFSHPGEQPLLRNVDLELGPGDRLGIVGANGTGKSTLLNLIDRTLEPDSGEVHIGQTVRLALYDQTSRELTPGKRLRQVVTGDDSEPSWQDVRFMERFWFDSDAQKAPVELLSGGERRRLQLVQVLMRQPNVLMLDEPTNDLDLDTLRVLEDFLDDWPGTLIVVSHDRAFLERTVEDVVVLDGSGSVTRTLGGYEAWEAERRANRKRGKGGPAKASAPVQNGKAAAPSAVPEAKARSHSTLRRLMKDAEKQIAKLSKQRDALRSDLVEAGADHVELARIGTEEATVSAALSEVEDAWMELAEEAERLTT